MSNDFNYDGDDQELDENGLPIYTDDEDDYEGDTSSQDLMDMIRRARGEENDDDDEKDDNDADEDPDSSSYDEDNRDSKSKNEGEGGRYGDNPPSQSKDILNNGSSLSTPTSGQGGGSDWFSKLTGGGKGGMGQATSQASKEAGKQAAKQAGQAAAKASGQAVSSALAAAAPYIGIALLIILAIILVVVIITSIVAFFQSKTDPENMSSNPYVTSEYFYGTRVVYIDDEALTNSLQLSYKQYVVDVLTNIETNNPEITINITLPETFDNTAEIDTNISNMSLGIANIVATGASDYINIEFSTLYPQIEYFGLTTEQGGLVATFITQYIGNNSLLTAPDGTNISTIVETATSSESLQYIYNRCEKVMIKDEIATSEGLSDIKQRQYIASIYMPNKDIVVESSIYTIVSENDTFNATSQLIEENNGAQTIHCEKETTDNTDIITGFSAGKINVKKFTGIDENNISAFSAGISLFDAIKLSSTYAQYFTQNTESGIYTWKPTDSSLFYLTFDADGVFIFTDFDLDVKLP